MALPIGFRLRPPAPGDLEAVAEVLVAGQLATSEPVTLDKEFLRGEWGRPGFDVATDAWVVTGPAGTVVAYGQAVREEPDVAESWGIVHPRHRGLGIGAALLGAVEQRAAEMLAGSAAGRFRHTVHAGDDAAAALLRARGLRPVRHFWHMQIDLTGLPEPALSLEGISVTVIAPPGDLPAVHAVLEEAFADDWGHHPRPFDAWAEEETGHSGHDPGLWLLAREQGRPVAALTASTLGEDGWVDYLRVLPSHRGRGVGAALLQHSFTLFAARGVPRVILNVDARNPTGATALYERAGMRAVKQWDLRERPPGESRPRP
ncbi:GNAT family N-acetyltransferase [Sphaerisporangium sp. B11E5]|uniref:GNAT family N-acetyltransferase n=1 Tax=Sphaerisporangium sp. B11E5 TaxID=3153563 RepID=UPI00325E5862